MACLESLWTRSDLTDARSVAHLLATVGAAQNYDVVYRQFATLADLKWLIASLKKPKYRRFKVLYLALHGNKGTLRVGASKVSLPRLSHLLGRSWRGRHLLLGSCSTLNLPDRAIQAFLGATGLRSLSGYREPSDWLEGSALDMFVIDLLLLGYSATATHKWLVANCGGLVADYKFVIHAAPRA